jgi:hypothetical protein
MQDPTPPGLEWTDLVARNGRPRRTGLVLAAGFFLVAAGALGMLTAVALRSLDFPSPVDPSTRHAVSVIAVAVAGFGVVQIVTGVLILGQSRLGRMLGIVLSAIGIVGSILQLGVMPARALILLALNGVVMYTLTAHKALFGRFDD